MPAWDRKGLIRVDLSWQLPQSNAQLESLQVWARGEGAACALGKGELSPRVPVVKDGVGTIFRKPPLVLGPLDKCTCVTVMGMPPKGGTEQRRPMTIQVLCLSGPWA